MENKKNPKLDLRKKSGLFLNIGFAISLSFVLLAFEYKSYDTPGRFVINNCNFDPEESFDIPLTDQLIPPPPPKEIILIEIPNDELLIEEIENPIDNTFEELEAINELPEIADLPYEDVKDTFLIVEKMPTYPGGMKAFYTLFSKKLRYPSQARRMNVEGRVILSFIIGKDGAISNIKLLRGIGAGCDEEAIRILKKTAKWNPGKQRGKAVKVQMTIPINFKLN